MTKADNIYANPLDKVDAFKFDSNVADVFPDMIKRSVPGYQTMIETIGQLASRYVRPRTHVYDLGCSLGAASFAVARSASANACRVFAIDNSPAMVERCQRIVNGFNLPNPINVRCESVLDTKFTNASMVVMNFTLQFIDPTERDALISKIYDGLNPGGILVLSEKIRHPDEVGDNLLIDLHHSFKLNNGYSELEVGQKRAALENVLRTDTLSTHESRLTNAGFNTVMTWYQCFNFCSLVAIKK